jgi:hypothetical protein
LSFRRLRSIVFSLLLGIAGVFHAAAAFAAEQEWHLGGRAGIGVLSGLGPGPAFGVHGAYGLNDMFDITLELNESHHFGGRMTEAVAGTPARAKDATDVLSASGGWSYKIDVFEWIPYVTALAGYYAYLGEPGPHGEHGSEFGASIQIGLDYLPMRELAFGADVRWHASFVDGLTFPLFTATLGAEYRWGW